jgi:16S rRNA (uracil1498-N3)-methyltransferase
MPHFYVHPDNINGNAFRITGEDVHYLANVRHYGVGDKLKLFDGNGRTMLGLIDFISKDEIKGTILKHEKLEERMAKVNLYQAVAKGERFDWLVEKAAELGVEKIIPLITERSVIKDISIQKHERWQRLAKAACQQCGRPELMEIGKPQVFNEIINRDANLTSLNIIPWEAEDSKTLKEIYNTQQNAVNINIFIGPEGGFSFKEIEHARECGLLTVTLGTSILRSETAGLLSTVLVLNLCGNYERK